MDPNLYNFSNFNPFVADAQCDNTDNHQHPQNSPPPYGSQYPQDTPSYPTEFATGASHSAFHPYHQNQSFTNMSQLPVEHSPPTPTSEMIGSQYPDYSTQNYGNDDNITPSTGQGAKRGSGWKAEEDRLLISGWLNTSIDPITGTNQKGNAFWKRVASFYEQHRNNLSYRSANMLKCRWQKVSAATSKFVGHYDKILARNESGKSENDKILDAHKLYREVEKSKFTFDHAWRMLRNQPKWRSKVDSNVEQSNSKRTRMNVEGEYTSSSNTDASVNDLRDPETIRPTGVKAAKRKEKAAASESEPVVSSAEKALREQLEDKKTRDVKMMDILQQVVDVKKGELKFKKGELMFRKIQTLQQTINNPSLTNDERSYYELKHSELVKKFVSDDFD